MLIPRSAFAALAAAVLLFSCHSKKHFNNTVSANVATDTAAVAILPADTMELQQLTGEYTRYAVQKFVIAAGKKVTVTGSKGLKVTVNPAVLEKMDGSATDGPVELRMVELTNSSDMFKANAATVSNGRLLVSGGSYLVEMFCNGLQLRVKKGCAVQVDFPVLRDGEMELFYGQRDDAGNMNWQRAGVPLEKEYEPVEVMFTDSNRYSTADFMPVFMYDTNGNARIYKSTSEQVYYYDKKITIAQLVDTVNRYSSKIFIDTVNMWPKAPVNIPAGARIDSNFLYRVYGPPKQFIIKRCKDVAEEAAKKEKARLALQEARDNWQPKTLAGQLKKYYATANIVSLGWLNCDRFYSSPQNSDVEVELPYTFNAEPVHYFLIFNSFTGLINGSARIDSLQHFRLANLPNNQQVTLVAFIKSGGKIFQCRKDFTVAKNTIVKTSFEEISAAELKKIFGSNVRI